MRTFAELFVGRDDAYGTYEITLPSVPFGQKVEGKGRTKREPVTQELYDRHNAGELSIGIVPIRTDNTVMWFAIDVDTYDDRSLHLQLLNKIKANSLPLIMTTTKSGGAHLWCFLKEDMPAKDAVDVAKQYLKILSLPETTEIFPKQIEVDETNVGNWINLPYFGDTRVHVYLKDDNLEEAPLPLFIKHANEALASKDISHVYAAPEQADNPESDAPPCIDSFELNGVPEGGRNNVLFHVATYMKRKYPDEWEDKLFEWNQEHCNPVMTFGEVAIITGQHQKQEWQYKCSDQPMCSVCNPDLCKTRKFGIGRGLTEDDIPFRVGQLRKINSEIPIYYMNIDGQDIRMSIEDLMDYKRIRKLVLMRLDKPLPYIKQQTWDSFLTEIMHDVIIEDAPAIVGETGLILDLLRRYLSTFSQDEGRDQTLNDGNPYVDGERAYFQSFDFLNYLVKEIKGVRHERIWSVLKEEAGAKEETYGDNKLWVVPWRGQAREGSGAF